MRRKKHRYLLRDAKTGRFLSRRRSRRLSRARWVREKVR